MKPLTNTQQIRKQLIYFTTLWILCNAHVQPLTLRTHSGRGWGFTWPATPPPSSRNLSLTLHTHCWLAIPLPLSSTNQGSNYNHTHQMPAQDWATEINKGNALLFKLGFHLKYFIIFKKKKKEHWQYSVKQAMRPGCHRGPFGILGEALTEWAVVTHWVVHL